LGSSLEIAAAGRALYNQNCTKCHGLDAAAGDRAPALAAQRSYNRTADQDLFDAITKGLPGTDMPAVGLSTDDSWRIVAYIRSLRASAADFPPDGDVAQGEAIYNGKGQCGTCHTINGRGGLIGPDLTNLGARATVRRIREALTVAQPHPPAGYRPVLIRLNDGSSVRGVLKNENNFSFQVLGMDDRLHLLSSDEIERVVRYDASLMPSDYDKRLAADELTNLIAYLSRLVR
jgi:putative heme-binding domain-containing protein